MILFMGGRAQEVGDCQLERGSTQPQEINLVLALRSLSVGVERVGKD